MWMPDALQQPARFATQRFFLRKTFGTSRTVARPGGREGELVHLYQHKLLGLFVVARGKTFFHIHLVSDATGETLNTVARAAAAQYSDFQAIEHVHSLVRSAKLLDRVVQDIEEHPGIVLFTIVDEALRDNLEAACKRLEVPCISVLDPVVATFASYLNAKSTPQIGGQHALNAEYFRRIDALNYTMLHDDGQHPEGLGEADIVLVGVSRTSKTPTSIYLANRGIKVANVPIVPGVPMPDGLPALTRPLIIGLVASVERIVQIRRNRLLSLNETAVTDYIDKAAIAEEIANARKICQRHEWPVLDVSRRSIEETAAAIMSLHHDRTSAA
jgi:hypothetical protein